jgi:hypothetical protein
MCSNSMQSFRYTVLWVVDGNKLLKQRRLLKKRNCNQVHKKFSLTKTQIYNEKCTFVKR